MYARQDKNMNEREAAMKSFLMAELGKMLDEHLEWLISATASSASTLSQQNPLPPVIDGRPCQAWL